MPALSKDLPGRSASMDRDFKRPCGCSSVSRSTSLENGNSSVEYCSASGSFNRGAGGAGLKILAPLLLAMTIQFFAMRPRFSMKSKFLPARSHLRHFQSCIADICYHTM
jgi:hypothetical protein